MKEPHAREVPWSDELCICKTADGQSTLLVCPACMTVVPGSTPMTAETPYERILRLENASAANLTDDEILEDLVNMLDEAEAIFGGGPNVLEFGTGAIGVIVAPEVDDDHLLCVLGPLDTPGEIGEVMERIDRSQLEVAESDTVLRFANVESLDVLLGLLIEGRRRRGWGEYRSHWETTP